MMNRDKKFYWDLFSATFQLSMFTLGGGFVIVPLMRKKFMEEKHWIDEDEMMDLTAIAQSAPGSMAVNASILVGYRLAGIMGVFVTVLGTVLPPLIILTIISMFYAAFKSNTYVAMAMKGMQACVAAIIIDVVITMGKGVLAPKKWLPYVILIGSFLAVFFFANLGVKMGGKPETFCGLSGIGDLIVTCCSMHSRNRRAGILIGEGVSPEEAVKQVGTVEGYYCCHAAWKLAQMHHVSMPITEQLYHVLRNCHK